MHLYSTHNLEWEPHHIDEMEGEVMCILHVLPEEVLVTIIGKVASTSLNPMEDLQCLRVSCRRHAVACRQTYVLKLIPLDRIHYDYQKGSGMKTVRWLASAGNMEAIFVQALGMIGIGNPEGYVHLERAAEGGVVEAAYLQGLSVCTTFTAQSTKLSGGSS